MPFDEVSNLKTATNTHGTVTFDYDERNQMWQTGDVWGRSNSHNYDKNGNRTFTWHFGNGLSGSSYLPTYGVTYGYDQINRLTTVDQNSGGTSITTLNYDAVNRLRSRVFPNGVTETADYDDLDRLKILTHTKGAATLASFGYGYDERNLINQMTEGANTHTFGYDELQRLTSAVHPAPQASENYSYDEVGNRTSSHLTTTYNTQPFNRVVQIGGTTFTYDNNGNLKTKTDGTATATYDYDYENRLMSVHLPTTPPKTIHYRYDALGRRIEREDTSTGAWQRYTYDGWEMRSEENSDGSWVSYVNGDEIDDHLLQRRKSPGNPVIYEYYLSNHQGSISQLTDENGNVISGNSYDTFGNRTGTIASRFGYTGREHDPDTGLMYYRARWYSPETGRFVSEDPIGFEGGDNCTSLDK